MNKMPIISAYVEPGLQKIVSFFKRFSKAGQSKAKMEGKLHSGGSEIAGRFGNFSNTNVDAQSKKSLSSPKLSDLSLQQLQDMSQRLDDDRSDSLMPFRL